MRISIMTRTPLLTGCLLSLPVGRPCRPSAGAPPPPPPLSVHQIVDKNIAARGGLSAWRGVKTLTIAGELDAGGKPNHALPFVLKEKRSRKSRLEIVFADKTSLQGYDGIQGWKVRPFLNRNEAETYTPAATKSAAYEQDLDGPLLDYAAKGTQVAFVGTEAVEGHPAYKLKQRAVEVLLVSG